MAPTNFVCGHCGSDIASYVCFCTRPLTYLCLACTQGHKGKGVCKIRPITSEFDLEELAATFQEERRSSCFGQAKCCLRANEMKVKHYQNYVEDLKNSWLKEIEDWYDQKTKEMSEFEDCTMGLVEDLDSTIEEKEMRESPPRDMFEESIACLDPDSVDEVCKELSAVVQFQPVALSLGSVFAEVPDIVLTRPPTIGVKRLSVHFQGRTFPIYCKTDLPEELLFLIKQELHLDTNPTVMLENGDILTENTNLTELRHGSELRVDCTFPINVTCRLGQVKITVHPRDTVLNLKRNLGRLWGIEEDRIKLRYQEFALDDQALIDDLGVKPESEIVCGILSSVFVKPKLVFKSREVSYTDCDTPNDVKKRLDISPSFKLTFNAQSLDDALTLHSQGVTHMSTLVYDESQVSSPSGISIVLLSTKRKFFNFPSLHLQTASLLARLVELKEVSPKERNLVFLYGDQVLEWDTYLDQAGVQMAGTIRMKRGK